MIRDEYRLIKLLSEQNLCWVDTLGSTAHPQTVTLRDLVELINRIGLDPHEVDVLGGGARSVGLRVNDLGRGHLELIRHA